MDKNLNRFVSVNMAKDMANKHRKRYSTSLFFIPNIVEIQFPNYQLRMQVK